jgi:iron complex outermembrane receptor protein
MEISTIYPLRYNYPRLKKLLLVMRLTITLIIAGCLHLSATTLGQNITVIEKNVKLEKVLSKIEKQSGYTFWYNTDLVKRSPKVSLDVKDYSLEKALDACFKDLPITYTIVQNTIVLKSRASGSVAVQIQRADPINIKGKVIDDHNLSLPGVTVRLKGTKVIAITDANGQFQINVPDKSAILVFTYIGFNSQEVTIGENNNITVSLVPAAQGLSEISVTSYGIEKKTNDLGYSVTTIKGDELDRTNTVNPINALQGKVAGVVINSTSAAGVQTSPFIQIRGGNSLPFDSSHPANNQPIFVIDGNILSNNVSSPDGADGGSQLKNLNPDDYESITVLKGAAATALYGSRGINGAVVIATKSGKLKEGLGVEFSSTYSATNVYKSFMALQNEFGMGSYSREGAFRPDGSQSQTTSNWGPAFDGTLHPADYDATRMVPYVAQPNNWKAFYQTGKFLNNNVTLSGGSDKSTYRLSYSNTDNDGLLPNNGLKRNAIDLKYTGQINKVFSTEFGVNYANTVTKNYYNQSRYAYGGGQNLGFDVYYYPRNTDFNAWHNDYRNADNSVKPDPFNGINWAQNAFTTIDKNNYANHENSVLAYLLLKAQVNTWLDFSARGNVNYYTQFSQEEDYGNNAANQGGYYGTTGSSNTDYNLLLMAHASKKLMHNDLNVDFRLINEYYGNRLGQNYFAHTDGGLGVPNQFTLTNSVNNLVYSTDSNGKPNGDIGYTTTRQSKATIGVGGVLNLNYKQYLNLELTARNDWLSALTYPTSVIGGANNYSVFYPSANLSWSFYDQYKDKMPQWLSSGRLRGSIALTGNAGLAPPYSTSNGYTPSTVLDQNGNSIGIANQINGNVRPNLNLKPQTKREIELGTNFSLFKNLITVDFAWYKSNTFNQLLYTAGVPETGYNLSYFNAGNIQNSGVELAIDVNPIRTSDWNLDFSVNLAHNASKIIDFAPGINEWQLGGYYEGAMVYAYKGGAFGELTLDPNTTFQLDPKTGYPIIKNAPRATNANANTHYDFADYQYAYNTATATQPRIKMGKVEPNITGGITATLRYKSLSLFTQVDARFGGMTYSESYTYAMGQGSPLASLKYRDQAHGGVARVDSYTGKTVYDGAVPNAVFAAGEKSQINGADIGGMTFKQAYDKGLVESWYAPAYYDGGPGFNGTYDWENGLNYNGAVAENSWIMLREITLGYQLPTALVKKIKVFKSARLSVTARNIGYLYKTLPGDQNPESLQSNDPFNPYITGGVPYARTYAVSLNVRF